MEKKEQFTRVILKEPVKIRNAVHGQSFIWEKSNC
jgi:hypothetical protein